MEGKERKDDGASVELVGKSSQRRGGGRLAQSLCPQPVRHVPLTGKSIAEIPQLGVGEKRSTTNISLHLRAPVTTVVCIHL